MTLLEMAEQVAERIGVADDHTLAQAKKFLKRRYALVYDSQLWSETLIAVPHTNTDEEDIVHVPSVMEKVLQIRYGSSGSSYLLQQINHQQVFQINPDALDEEGDRVAWTELQPAATWEPVAATNYFAIIGTNTGDTTQQVTIKGHDTSGISESVSFTLNLAGTARVYQDVNGDYITGMTVVEMISKPETLGLVSVVKGTDFTDILTSTDKCTSLASWETSRQHVRVQLLRSVAQTAASTESLLFYGKRRLVPLVGDTDTPVITKIDDVLIALATADMLERERQYGKAQIKVQEGNALLANRLMSERNQKGNRMQIIPSVEVYNEEGLMY